MSLSVVPGQERQGVALPFTLPEARREGLRAAARVVVEAAAPAPAVTPRQQRRWPVRRVPVERLLVVLGVVMVPWLALLAAAGQWGWTVLDLGEAAGLLTTGRLLRRVRARVLAAVVVGRAAPGAAAAAVTTAALLLADAGTDLATAAPAALPVAVAMAVAAELPVAALCLAVAGRVRRHLRPA